MTLGIHNSGASWRPILAVAYVRFGDVVPVEVCSGFLCTVHSLTGTCSSQFPVQPVVMLSKACC